MYVCMYVCMYMYIAYAINICGYNLEFINLPCKCNIRRITMTSCTCTITLLHFPLI